MVGHGTKPHKFMRIHSDRFKLFLKLLSSVMLGRPYSKCRAQMMTSVRESRDGTRREASAPFREGIDPGSHCSGIPVLRAPLPQFRSWSTLKALEPEMGVRV